MNKSLWITIEGAVVRHWNPRGFCDAPRSSKHVSVSAHLFNGSGVRICSSVFEGEFLFQIFVMFTFALGWKKTLFPSHYSIQSLMIFFWSFNKILSLKAKFKNAPPCRRKTEKGLHRRLYFFSCFYSSCVLPSKQKYISSPITHFKRCPQDPFASDNHL